MEKNILKKFFDYQIFFSKKEVINDKLNYEKIRQIRIEKKLDHHTKKVLIIGYWWMVNHGKSKLNYIIRKQILEKI